MAVNPVKQSGPQRLLCVNRNTNAYAYPGKEHFCDLVDREYHALEQDRAGTKSQYIIISDLDEQTFLKDFFNSSNKRFSHSYCDYIPALGLLLVKMTTEAHEQGHKGLDNLLIAKLVHMNNLNMELHMTAQAVKESNSRKKKADLTYRPRDLPPGRSSYWPTVVIGSAYSDNRSKLAGDARWWLSEAGENVKTVLTIAVHQTRREVNVENWELMQRPTRQDEGRMVPEVTQRAIVSQVTAEQPVRVTGDPLVIPFPHFFLRPACPSEGDIIFDESDLKHVANLVWEVHRNV